MNVDVNLIGQDAAKVLCKRPRPTYYPRKSAANFTYKFTGKYHSPKFAKGFAYTLAESSDSIPSSGRLNRTFPSYELRFTFANECSVKLEANFNELAGVFVK